MKLIAIALNIGALLTIGFLLISNGAPKGSELLPVAPWVFASLASIFALLATHDESWLGLYLKRKALEEKIKIAALSAK